MKSVKIILMVLTMSVLTGKIALAQEEITDTQVGKYAILSSAIDYMKKDISVELNKMIKAQEGMTGQRYKELASAKGDESKLDEMGAKDYEKQFMGLVTKLMEDRKDAIKAVNSELATKMVGDKGKTYKEIKAQLKADETLKARYDAIIAQVKGE